MKLTEADIKARIEHAEFFRIENTTTTLCVVYTVSGFIITGTSACIDPAEFDAEIGREMAYKDALRQLWDLEGYRVSCALHESKIAEQSIAVVEKPGIIMP